MDIQTRAMNIITKPAVEWSAIASESTAASDLITGYAAPLSAIGAVCRFIGFSFIGISMPFMATVRIGIFRGLTSAVVSWVLGLVSCYVFAMVIEWLAPKFQSHGNTVQALKLVVYAFTPVWLAGVLSLIPALSPLAIIAALYAVYLFYLGLPKLMGTPDGQVIPYMAVSAIAIIIVSVVIGMITAVMTGVGLYY